MTPWPHQTQAVQDVLAAIARGERRLALTSPTGGGKSFVLQLLAQDYLAQDQRVLLYTNRKLLIEQLSDVFVHAGITHGVRAAGWEEDPDARFQIASIQTEHSRSVRKRSQEHFPAQLVLVDEAHLHTGPMAKGLLDRHYADGAVLVGATATPLGLQDTYDRLIVAGTVSELRACGALVLANHYGPDEPDLRSLKGMREGEDLSETQQREAMGFGTDRGKAMLFGRIFINYCRLNPSNKPTLVFAGSVEQSVWIAKQFAAKGVTAAHIDGEEIWMNGVWTPSTPDTRQEVLDGSREGRITVLCNRFLFREGIDAPWLGHGIFACVIGSGQSYLQAGGRLLRAAPGKDFVTIQDHGGNWHRHGSLNADRIWRLADTNVSVTALRHDRLRDGGEKEPLLCPKCQRVLNFRTCPCGYEIPPGKRARPVYTTEGDLRYLGGAIYPPRRTYQAPNGPQLWQRMYYRSCTAKGERTFRQAFALFAYENRWGWPSLDWPLMPRDPLDQFRLVKDVPKEDLTS